MENLYFKMIVQKTANGKSIMVAVIPDDLICDGLPSIFEIQAVRTVPTIYSGTYPAIRLIPETITDRTEDLKGLGISGIITSESWYNSPRNSINEYGIDLIKND